MVCSIMVCSVCEKIFNYNGEDENSEFIVLNGEHVCNDPICIGLHKFMHSAYSSKNNRQKKIQREVTKTAEAA